MGKAGKALKQVSEAHGISQSRLAIALGVEHPIVSHWFHEQTDPTAETVVRIVEVLREINSSIAEDFIRLYLGSSSRIDEVVLPIDEVRELPASDEVDVRKLSRLFDKTTNSYKYLFFISLLDILKRRQFDALSPISFKEIIVEMLANAWYPHTYFKLSFGSQDKIADKLNFLNLNITEPVLKFADTDKKLLRGAIKEQNLDDIVAFIGKYVPFRLIRPFFKQETVRLPDSTVNQRVIDLASSEFETRKPLYCFNAHLLKDCQTIILHQDWVSYIETNYPVIRGWVYWEWLNYMQQKNPSVPGIVNKLFMPQERGSLAKQTKYWKLIVRHTTIHCVYSSEAISANNFSLDHYLPWSFVAHDQLWNLVPTLPEVNSSKSNNLPSPKYFAEFVLIQHLGLTASHENLGEQAWSNYVESYISDLRVSTEDLLDAERLTNAYESTTQPLLTLAAKQGFNENWS